MNELIARFDAAFPAMWDDYESPTTESIARIEARFGFTIPPLLVEFARKSNSYSSFFLSLGPDYSFHSHIIAKNEFIRSDAYWLSMGRPAPSGLVFLTENFMEDFFWCLDIRGTTTENAVVLWRSGSGVDMAASYANFEHFVLGQVEYYELRFRQ